MKRSLSPPKSSPTETSSMVMPRWSWWQNPSRLLGPRRSSRGSSPGRSCRLGRRRRSRPRGCGLCALRRALASPGRRALLVRRPRVLEGCGPAHLGVAALEVSWTSVVTTYSVLGQGIHILAGTTATNCPPEKPKGRPRSNSSAHGCLAHRRTAPRKGATSLMRPGKAKEMPAVGRLS